MMAWEVPSGDWDTLTVKTTRLRPGTREFDLLDSRLPKEWYLSDVAERFGPGTYRIQGGPGPYRTKNTTIHVSPEYARAAGWSPAPPMPVPVDPQQLLAQKTFLDAQKGPVDPLNLAQMIQTAMDAAVAKVAAQPAAIDPYSMVMKGFEMAMTMSEKVRSFGMPPQAEPVSKGWPDVVAEQLPSILGVVQHFLSKTSMQTPAQQPAAQAQVPALSHGGQPAMAQSQQVQYPAPPPDAVPILRLMKQYAGMLVPELANPNNAPEAIAQQLSGLLGPDYDQSIVALAQFVAANGTAVLGNVAPELATSEKAAQVLMVWAQIITEAPAE